MTAGRGRWLLGTSAALVVLLFAGQWIADFLADRWWATSLIPEAGGFVSGVRLLRLTLDASAILIGTAWYTGHLLIVHRAIGSVQISRQVANLEIREAVTPSTLLPLALGIGAALGLLAGLGSGREWPVFALAWQGVTYGATDPYLHRDLGVFVAQLPLWLLLHSFARLLAWSALAAVVALYVALGAIRWQAGRPAMSDYARRHVGLLVAGGALVLAWGFVLEPFVSAADRAPDPAAWGMLHRSTMGLAGACLATAAISALWAIRGRHLLMLASWCVLVAGMFATRLLLPDAKAATASDPSLDRLAYGFDRIDDRTTWPPPVTGIAAPALWTWSSIDRLVNTDSVILESAAPTTISVAGATVAVWLALRSVPTGPASVLAIADARTGPGAGPLSYRAGDSLAYPGLVTYTTLPVGASRPNAPRVVVDSAALGIVPGGVVRRVVLAWALQSTDLLRSLGPLARVRWHLAPHDRLQQLAPFASWEDPRLIVAAGGLVWVATGYLESRHFPGSTRLPGWKGEIGAMEAGIVGVVDAVTGATSLFLLPEAGPLSRSWASITQGMIRPPAELAIGLTPALSYPARLFDAHTRLVEREPWRAGTAVGRAADGQGDPAPPSSVWEGGQGLTLVAAYQGGTDRRVRTLLLGQSGEHGRRLTLLRLSDAASLPGPAAAQSTWERFPSYEQMLDSVVRRGQQFVPGPYRILPWGDAPIAYQPWFAFDSHGQVTQPYLALASDTRVGAARSFRDAWANLQGASAPLPPGSAPLSALDEARRWMLRADSALHAGDWEGFGRAFGALRQTLGAAAMEP